MIQQVAATTEEQKEKLIGSASSSNDFLSPVGTWHMRGGPHATKEALLVLSEADFEFCDRLEPRFYDIVGQRQKY